MTKTKTQRRVGKKSGKLNFDKYDLYRKAVQSPDSDVEFLEGVYKELRQKSPKVLREDFCGTFALATEWVKLNKKYEAIGVDLDPEPVNYGKDHYFSKLKPEQQNRLRVIEGNVLDPKLPPADILVAMNFSYFIFKNRSLLKSYFANVYRALNRDGVFIVDLFGGIQCQDAIQDTTKHKGFTYYWDQKGFDPLTGEALFYIHFRVGGKKIERVFTYDWRMWTIPELREIMHEVGFKKTHVYWEGTKKDGTGDGNFTRTEKGEACSSWIAYIACEK